MKNVILFIALLLGTIACTSQNPKAKAALDGRTFKIENYTGGEMEGTEMMTFKNGTVENDECTKWGFGNASYTLDEGGNFKYTLNSDAEGKMDWEGQVSGTSISGKMVWVKAGQEDIHYTFKGDEVK
jgi:hypothetical protein